MIDTGIFDREKELLFKDFKYEIETIQKEESSEYSEGVKYGIEFSKRKIDFLLNTLKKYFDANIGD